MAGCASRPIRLVARLYGDYRWQRQVWENLSLGRRIPIKERMAFEIRAEFFNNSIGSICLLGLGQPAAAVPGTQWVSSRVASGLSIQTM